MFSWEVEQLAAAQHDGEENLSAEYVIDFGAGLIAG